MENYLPIIGLEIHVELATKSKMFCPCSAEHFRVEPNTRTCPVCLGLPGALPVPNKRAIEWTVMLGLALGCKINKSSKFDRKHYFYPDLPKGYQISQYDEPLAIGGSLVVPGIQDKIRIRRVHLEEDTGKLLHRTIGGERVSLVDFNRSGVPLCEMVTEPDLHSAGEAKEFCKWFQRTVRYLGISEGDMEKGSMRLEANISLKRRAKGEKAKAVVRSGRLGDFDLPKYKVEVKNINSFRFLERAIEYEIKRQRKLLERGGVPVQETRGYDERKKVTFSQRIKEGEADYRYFPEPDIPPLELMEEMVERLGEQIPELPLGAYERLVERGVRGDFAEVIVASKEGLAGFDALMEELPEGVSVGEAAKQAVNQKWDLTRLSVEEMVGRLRASRRMFSMSACRLEELVEKVIEENPGAVGEYRKGKVGVLGFLVGQVVRLSKGEADPREARKVVGGKLRG